VADARPEPLPAPALKRHVKLWEAEAAAAAAWAVSGQRGVDVLVAVADRLDAAPEGGGGGDPRPHRALGAATLRSALRRLLSAWDGAREGAVRRCDAIEAVGRALGVSDAMALEGAPRWDDAMAAGRGKVNDTAAAGGSSSSEDGWGHGASPGARLSRAVTLVTQLAGEAEAEGGAAPALLALVDRREAAKRVLRLLARQARAHAGALSAHATKMAAGGAAARRERRMGAGGPSRRGSAAASANGSAGASVRGSAASSRRGSEAGGRPASEREAGSAVARGSAGEAGVVVDLELVEAVLGAPQATPVRRPGGKAALAPAPRRWATGRSVTLIDGGPLPEPVSLRSPGDPTAATPASAASAASGLTAADLSAPPPPRPARAVGAAGAAAAKPERRGPSDDVDGVAHAARMDPNERRAAAEAAVAAARSRAAEGQSAEALTAQLAAPPGTIAGTGAVGMPAGQPAVTEAVTAATLRARDRCLDLYRRLTGALVARLAAHELETGRALRWRGVPYAESMRAEVALEEARELARLRARARRAL